MGSNKYIVLVLLSCLACSLIACGIQAFFGLVPGLNDWTYDFNLWNDYAAMGQTALQLMLTIYMYRALGLKETSCCCFRMPVWLFYIVMFAFCQLMMDPPWYGVEYNVAAVIVGFVVPKKWITVKNPYMIQGGFGTPTGQASNNNDAEEQQQLYQINQPKTNQNKYTFSGKGKSLGGDNNQNNNPYQQAQPQQQLNQQQTLNYYQQGGTQQQQKQQVFGQGRGNVL